MNGRTTRTRRARLRALAGGVGVAVALVMGDYGTAHATVSPTPIKTAGLGGEAVFDLTVLDSGRVILGGRFTSVGTFPRSNLGAILPTGKPDQVFAPTTNGTVYAVAASEDGTRVFVGGTFTEVNGVARQNLAAVDAVTGALITDWQADTTGDVPIVRSLAVSGNRLYVGGKFKGIDGTAKQQLAAIDVTTGNVVTWATWVNGGVNEVRVSDDGTTVWIGGEFTRIHGIDRLYLGAIDATTGVPAAFSPTASGGRIISIELGPDESWIYASTDNNSVFAYQHAVSNAPTWFMKMSGNVQAMAATATDLYVGGHFSQFLTEHIARPFLGSANPYTGAATTWDPKATGLKGGGWALIVEGNYLHAGGQFTHFNGVQQRLYARFAGNPTP